MSTFTGTAGHHPDRHRAPTSSAAQVAVADYCPNWWQAATRLLIRRGRLDVDGGAVSADPRARRRRTLHPDQLLAFRVRSLAKAVEASQAA